MNFLAMTISALTIAMFTGCLNNEDAPTREHPEQTALKTRATRADFDASLAKWKTAKVNGYLFQVNMDCYCFPMGWMNITVLKDKVAQVDSVPGEQKLFEPTQVAYAPTIEFLFERIDPKLDDTSYTVKVEYDPNFGYPKAIEIRHNGDLRDAGLSASVVRFSPL